MKKIGKKDKGSVSWTLFIFSACVLVACVIVILKSNSYNPEKHICDLPCEYWCQSGGFIEDCCTYVFAKEPCCEVGVKCKYWHKKSYCELHPEDEEKCVCVEHSYVTLLEIIYTDPYGINRSKLYMKNGEGIYLVPINIVSINGTTYDYLFPIGASEQNVSEGCTKAREKTPCDENNEDYISMHYNISKVKVYNKWYYADEDGMICRPKRITELDCKELEKGWQEGEIVINQIIIKNIGLSYTMRYGRTEIEHQQLLKGCFK